MGWDNGSSGSIGIIGATEKAIYFPTPTKEVPNYTKEGNIVSRINCGEIKRLLTSYGITSENTRALIERPFMAPVISIDCNTFVDFEEAKRQGLQGMFTYIDVKKKVPTVSMMFLKSSLNAHRSFEATLITLESLRIGYEVVDSKAWQHELLGLSVKGSAALKAASKAKGIQMFPYLEKEINKQKDADGLLLAHYCQLYYNQ
jgi:hypothetical protein